jgi:hypothetical protein
MTYLLPSFAGRMQSIERRLADESASHRTLPAVPVPGSTSLTQTFSPIGGWESLPLPARESPSALATDDGIKVPSLQSALNQESRRANAAERRVAALQEEIGHLRESRNERLEEAMVLREQLAESETSASYIALQLWNAAIEENKQASASLLKMTASHDEVASLRANLSEAQKLAESERSRATFALEQLKVVKGQLAALAASQWGEEDIGSYLRPHEDKGVVSPLPADLEEVLPVSRSSPPPPPVYTSPSGKRGKDADRGTRQGKGKVMVGPRIQQVLPQTRARALVSRASIAEAAPVRRRGLKVQPETARLLDLGQVPRDPVALQLPNALLPDRRLW